MISYLSAAAVAAKSLPLYLTLWDPIDGSPQGSAIPGILQARTLEWVAIAFSNAWKWKVKVKSLSCVGLCNPMDCSLPGSSVHGIFQARVLEWVAIAFSNHSGNPSQIVFTTKYKHKTSNKTNTWHAAVHGVAKSQTWLSDWTELNIPLWLSFFSKLLVIPKKEKRKKEKEKPILGV